MGREARRAQDRAERRQKQQRATPPRRVAPSVSAPTVAGAEQRRGSLLRPLWARDIISELRKVTWPARREVANLTGVVIIVSLLLGLVLGGADLLFGYIVEQTLLR